MRACSLVHYSLSKAAARIEYFRSKPDLLSVNFLVMVLPEGLVRGVPQMFDFNAKEKLNDLPKVINYHYKN